ncbi:MAG: hypothetical protein AB7F86_12845 [Bdellovibrionales bacterium]
MAKILAIVDREPPDPDWKGAFAWQSILSLAESQHEVLVMTTAKPEVLEISHPRLTIARPCESWSLRATWPVLQTVLSFQPQIIHTFALKPPSSSWNSIWPLIQSLGQALPAVRTYSTRFDEFDFAPFSPAEPPIEWPSPLDESAARWEPKRVLIPAPVSEWQSFSLDLLMLADFLEQHTEWEAEIIGGWGDLNLLARREGWQWLGPSASRVRMSEPLGLTQFCQKLAGASALWLRGLDPRQWRSRISGHLATELNIPVLGPLDTLSLGSTSNYLSRLYLRR